MQTILVSILTLTVEKRQRSDEIRMHNPNSKWNDLAIYEYILTCLAYLKRPENVVQEYVNHIVIS